MKQFYIKFLVIFMILILTGCQNSSSRDTKSPTVNEKKEEDLSSIPTERFDISEANNVLPEDVIYEVAGFGGLGGGKICFSTHSSYSKPVLEDLPGSVWEPMETVGFSVCGWNKEEKVQLEMKYPDGKVDRETLYSQLNVDEGGTGEETYFVFVEHDFSFSDETGEYTFVLSWSGGSLSVTVTLKKPDGPRSYYTEEGDVLLYNFSPNEYVRLFKYQTLSITTVRFIGWKGYRVSETGDLLIRTGENNLVQDYTIIGDVSGELPPTNVGPSGHRMKVFNSIVKAANKDDDKSSIPYCPNAPAFQVISWKSCIHGYNKWFIAFCEENSR